ncbi:MAG: alpha/beta hydrolase [Clostridia bacterium]|nr:alpha/beta hydrolase [Clostridia bacterium]
MQVKRVSLQEEYGFGGYLDCMALDYPFDIPMDWSRPAVIVVPGGGYGMTSKREGEIVAAEFFARGYQAFVLWYEVRSDGASYPRQFLQLASAIDYVKKHAKEFSVKPDSVFAVGFSAGGHLVGSLATGHQDASAIAGKPLNASPAAVGLCYPVINYEVGHNETYENVLQGYEGEEKARLIEKLSLDKAVNDATPPAFIWTTAEDSVVDSRNSLYYALALAKRKIPYELHVYPQGEHGASTGAVEITNEMPHYKRISAWLDDCVSFFNLFVK